MIPEYTLFTIKPVALICAIRSLMVGSFLRTLFHGKFKNSVNLINHCSKNYNPARLQFCKNCEPQKIKRKSNYCNPETMSEVATKRISDSAVRSKTKRTWNEWFSILDDAGAKELTHKDIASYIYKNYNLSPWWSQMITVTYEQESGLRSRYQRPDGYSVSASKVLNCSIDKVYNYWADDKLRIRWLDMNDIKIRKARQDKSITATWIDGKTTLEVNFYKKGNSRSQVVVQHSKIVIIEAAVRIKLYWKKRLQRLASMSE